MHGTVPLLAKLGKIMLASICGLFLCFPFLFCFLGVVKLSLTNCLFVCSVIRTRTGHYGNRGCFHLA